MASVMVRTEHNVELDVLACPRCASRMQTIAIVQSLEGIQRLLPYSEEAELARGPPDV